jgi:L-amino acid N-acyltransferase YncA
MSFADVLTRFHDNRRRHGVGAALFDIGCVAMNRVARLQVLNGMAVQLGDVTDPQMFEAPPGFEGRFLEAEQMEEFARAGTCELDLPFVEAAVRRGDRCYAVFTEEALAAYGWYSQQPTRIDDNFTLHFDPAYAYMYKGYTLPAYRGKRLHAFGMCQALRAVTAEGLRGLVSYVAANNFASLKATSRMGYRSFGDIYLMRLAGRPFAYATAGCRPYDFWAEPNASVARFTLNRSPLGPTPGPRAASSEACAPPTRGG